MINQTVGTPGVMEKVKTFIPKRKDASRTHPKRRPWSGRLKELQTSTIQSSDTEGPGLRDGGSYGDKKGPSQGRRFQGEVPGA